MAHLINVHHQVRVLQQLPCRQPLALLLGQAESNKLDKHLGEPAIYRYGGGVDNHHLGPSVHGQDFGFMGAKRGETARTSQSKIALSSDSRLFSRGVFAPQHGHTARAIFPGTEPTLRS